MHSKIDNIEIMLNGKADEVIEELFDSFIKEYQNGLQKSMRLSDFIFDCVHLLYYKCHKINPNHGRWSTDYPDWIKN